MVRRRVKRKKNKLFFVLAILFIIIVIGGIFMFNKSDESGHPCLTPFLEGIAFGFSPLSMMLATHI